MCIRDSTCVDRELREETGYALRADMNAAALEPLPQAGYSSTGLTDETVQVVFAQVEKVADAQPEPSEYIEPFLLPIQDVRRFLAENILPIGTRAQLVLEPVSYTHLRQIVGLVASNAELVGQRPRDLFAPQAAGRELRRARARRPLSLIHI